MKNLWYYIEFYLYKHDFIIKIIFKYRIANFNIYSISHVNLLCFCFHEKYINIVFYTVYIQRPFLNSNIIIRLFLFKACPKLS